MSTNVRMASLADIETLVKVRFDYFSTEKWEVSSEQRDLIENNLRQYYAKHLGSDFFAAFVEVASQVVSVAFLSITNLPANLSFPTGKTGTILNVLTYPEYRKKGYATSTMNMLLDEAKTQGLSYVELSASESGKPLYQKLGFEESRPSTHFTKMKLGLV